jgi:replicative DNA helicase
MEQTYTNTISEDYAAACILNNPVDTLNQLKAEGGVELFHNYLPRKVYNMALSLVNEGREHEVETLEFSDPIKSLPNGAEEKHGISSIRCQYAGMSWFDQHLKNLKNEAALRRATRIVSDASEAIKEGQSPEQISEALREGSRAVMGIVSSDDDIKDSSQCVDEFEAMLLRLHKGGEARGMRTGVAGLDEQTGGLSKNQLWVVGAQTSRGKTVLMFQMMAQLLQAKKHVMLVSLETDAELVLTRLAANILSIPMSKMLGTHPVRISEPMVNTLQAFNDRLRTAELIHVSDSSEITLESISAQADRLREKGYPVDCIVVDYIQLVAVSDTRDKARHEQVAEVTRTLKQLAKRYQCPVITATQLNDDGRVRESRAITHDADVVLKISDDRDSITIEKNRNGQSGYVLPLSLNGEYQRFE